MVTPSKGLALIQHDGSSNGSSSSSNEQTKENVLSSITLPRYVGSVTASTLPAATLTACSCSSHATLFRSLPLLVIINNNGLRRNLKPRSKVSKIRRSGNSWISSASTKYGRGPEPDLPVSRDTARKKLPDRW